MKNPLAKKKSASREPQSDFPSGAPMPDGDDALTDFGPTSSDPTTGTTATRSKKPKRSRTSRRAKNRSTSASTPSEDNPDGIAQPEKPSRLTPAMKKTLLSVGAAAVLAVSGVLMLVNYVRSAEQTASGSVVSFDGTDVLVVNEPIPAGTSIDVLREENFSRVRVSQLPAGLVPSGALRSIEDLAGMTEGVAVVDLQPGEALLASRFASADQIVQQQQSVDQAISLPDLHYTSFRISAERVIGGLLVPGDLITISATFDSRDGYPNLATVVLDSVEVVNVQGGTQAATPDESGLIPAAPATTGELVVTVAVTSEELAELHYTIDYGRILVATASAPQTDLSTTVRTLSAIVEEAGGSIDPVTGEFRVNGDDPAPASGLAFNEAETGEPGTGEPGTGEPEASVEGADDQLSDAQEERDEEPVNGRRSPLEAFIDDLSESGE